MNERADPLSTLNLVLDRARQAGAEAADAVLVSAASLGVTWRLGELEEMERSEDQDVGLRVFIGQQQAIVSSSDISDAALAQLAERAVDMARHAPADQYCGLAAQDQLVKDWPGDLDLADDYEPTADSLMAIVEEAEDAARAVEGITNSEGASAGWGRNAIALATSHGFAGAYETTSFSISASVLAGEGTEMERDYDYVSTRHNEDLESPAAIGRGAAERTVRRLNPRTKPSCKVPVVYDPRVSGGLVGHLAGAVNGASVARGTSFLKDAMGEQVFGDGISIIDDPLRHRGLRSKPFDAEGLATRRTNLVQDGRLQTWILDCAAARQLGLTSTGHATRGTGGPPSASATNLYMEAGSVTPAALIADIEEGFYVTELIGMGVNQVTGDYSRGAGGFWIENGEIVYPVAGLTVAGNLKDMFRAAVPADDLEFRYGVNAPTIRIDGMTIAGS
ncbi:MAG: TldD/PmbA family protein [Alphaproteobacteria bacterium]